MPPFPHEARIGCRDRLAPGILKDVETRLSRFGAIRQTSRFQLFNSGRWSRMTAPASAAGAYATTVPAVGGGSMHHQRDDRRGGGRGRIRTAPVSPFLYISRAVAACGGGAPESNDTAPARRDGASISGPRKWASDPSRPPAGHAAKGVSSAAGSLSCSAGSASAGVDNSNATRAAAFTLPTPPRAV